jgi:hypothetical protein
MNPRVEKMIQLRKAIAIASNLGEMDLACRRNECEFHFHARLTTSSRWRVTTFESGTSTH